jgi:hypothetical protein
VRRPEEELTNQAAFFSGLQFVPFYLITENSARLFFAQASSVLLGSTGLSSP